MISRKITAVNYSHFSVSYCQHLDNAKLTDTSVETLATQAIIFKICRVFVVNIFFLKKEINNLKNGKELYRKVEVMC